MAKDDKLIAEVKEFYDLASSQDMDNRQRWLDDIRFYNGEQWPDALRRLRESDPNGARPCLTINKLPLHVHQVTNDVRQNPPSIKVHPVDDKADVKTAEVLNGIIRHIEYQSNADIAYFTANENQVIAGVGYWRVITDIEDEETNKQEIYIKPIQNIFTVYFDPNSLDPCGQDAERVLVTHEMPKEEFEEKYPKAALVDFSAHGIGDNNYSAWVTKDTVRVGEYWIKEEQTVNKLLVEGGGLMTEEEYWAFAQETMTRPFIHGKRSFTTEKIKWYKTNGVEILESGDWAGKYIPIVRVPGEIVNLEGKQILKGLVNGAKDPARMYNFWVSAETELIALQPKAPFIVAAGTLDGFEDRWAAANISNFPYLEYNPIDVNGNPAQMPQRQPFAGSPNGIINAKMGASDDLKATTGQFDASLGMRSNETSGRAILARQKEGDVGTYHFIDNMGKAIRYTGRILIDLIPKIYDTARVVRIVGEDDTVSQAMLDPEQNTPVRKVRGNDGNIKTIYNPSIGQYDVTVSTGPSYNTKRMEAFDAMTQLVQGNPQLWPIIGDLIVKNMDWPGSEAMAKRLKAMLPPQVAQLEQDEEQDIPPQVKAQMAQMQQQLQQFQKGIHDAALGLQEKDKEIQDLQSQLKDKDESVEVDQYKAVTERMKVEADIAIKNELPILQEQIGIISQTIAHLIEPVEDDSQEVEEMPPMNQQPSQPSAGFLTPEQG